MSASRKLVFGALGGLLFAAVGMSCSFLQLSILIRHVSVELAGIWILFANLGGYAMFLDLGLTPTLGREISFAHGNPQLSDVDRARRIATLIHSCTAIVAILAVLVFVIGGSLGWSYLRTIVPPALYAQVRPAWFIFILGAALNLVGQGWFAGLYGLGEVLSEKIIRSASAVFGLVFITAAILTHRGLIGLALAYLLQALSGVLLARAALHRITTHSTEGAFDLNVVRGLVVPSLKYAATLLGGILILQTDNIVIASTLGTTQVPNYQAVAKLVTALMTLSMMLVLTSMPLASQAYARGDIPAILQILNRNLRFTLGLIVVIGSFLACFADKVIELWLGANHFVGFPVLWVLLAVTLLEAYAQAMAAATISTGRIVFIAPALIAGVFNIGLSIVLADRFGLLGVVLGTMLAQLLTNHWYVPWYTIRLFQLDVRTHIRRVILPLAALMAVMLSLNAAVRMLTRSTSHMVSCEFGLLCSTLAGGFFFGAVMLDSGERKALLRRFKKLRTGLPEVL